MNSGDRRQVATHLETVCVQQFDQHLFYSKRNQCISNFFHSVKRYDAVAISIEDCPALRTFYHLVNIIIHVLLHSFSGYGGG